MRKYAGVMQGAGGMVVILAAMLVAGFAVMNRSLDAAEHKEQERSQKYLGAHATTHAKIDTLARDVDSIKEWTRP